jgi:hypothetical protein
MAPKDPTPRGGEILQPPNRTIPQPRPGEESDEPVLGNPVADEAGDQPDIPKRPALPRDPQRMAADIEDEEADPVIDSGPGIDDGVKSLKKQKG